MEFLIDFFEELDEMVYVSELETHRLVYMNRHLRQSLGYEKREEYMGKPCYEVLQGGKGPCDFCTNRQLEAGKFFSWTHKNPVLNKRYLIKDSIVICGEKRYRIEIAIDVDSEVVCQTPYYYARSETILNECLQRVFSTTDPEKGLNLILEHLGTSFQCDRVYVFEIGDAAHVNNTYEWCAPGVTPQREILQKLPISSVDWWMEMFRQNQVVLIQDLEEIRTQYPVAYAILKPQNVSALAAGPVTFEGRIVGFLGVDNPSQEMMTLLTPILNVIGYFAAALLKQRDLLKRLNALSFHDPLTGAFNRNAMFEHSTNNQAALSMGVIYCDITGLKQVNDSLGHGSGDCLIKHCFDMLQETLDTPWIYRTGGDEFVAVFRNKEKSIFLQNVRQLQERIQQDKHHMAVGYVWSDQAPFNLESLITQADKVMYQDKREYYASNYQRPGVDRRRRSGQENERVAKKSSLFDHFLATTYHDMEFLFQSISKQNSVGYFYFGDMQKDLFYVSDNMRDEFGFPSNVVPGLLREWGKRISTVQYREMYKQELRSMLQEKRIVHDMRYQVRNASGKNIWVRCYGLLKWDEEKQIPLFFSGRVTHQDDNFVVDPITNFPRESAAFIRMNELRTRSQRCLTIGFSLNSITELNSTRGRTYSDHLVGNIADDLMNGLAGKMTFYRLEGMRCMAVVDPQCQESKEQLVDQIRSIIEAGYPEQTEPRSANQRQPGRSC